MTYDVLRRPLGAATAEDEFYDQFDCDELTVKRLVRSLRDTTQDWWYFHRESTASPEDRKRFW